MLIFGTRLGIPEFQFNEIPPISEASSSFTQISNNTVAFTNFLTSLYRREVILKPKEFLGLYSSSFMQEKGVYLKFSDFLPLQHSILVSVDCTVPLKITN